MSRFRTITTLLLAVWLPLSCCCRLQAAAEFITRALQPSPESHQSCSGCCHHEADRESPSKPAQTGECGCGAKERVYLPGTGVAVPDLRSDIAIDGLPLVLPPAPPEVRHAADRLMASSFDEVRLKPSPTLLRLHCALTI